MERIVWEVSKFNQQLRRDVFIFIILWFKFALEMPLLTVRDSVADPLILMNALGFVSNLVCCSSLCLLRQIELLVCR